MNRTQKSSRKRSKKVKEEVKEVVKEEEAESDGIDPSVIFKNWRKLEEGTKLDR